MRRKACRGELPIPLHEKIEILVVLAAGKDEESRNCASNTLENWDPGELQQVLSNPSTSLAVLEYLAYNIAPGRKELEFALLENRSLPGPLHQWIEDTVALFAEAESRESAEAPSSLQSVEAYDPSSLQEGAQRQATLPQKVRRMSVLQKIRAALIGSHEERMALIHDPNKLVARAVLQSPKVSENEGENFASMRDVNEELLRLIAQNRRLMKNYTVIHALVNNPRTPIDVGLPLLHHINDRDMRSLAHNRNVSDVIRNTAHKFIQRKQEGERPKFMDTL